LIVFSVSSLSELFKEIQPPLNRSNKTAETPVFRAGFADVLHPDSAGDHGLVDNALLSTVRRLLLLHSDTGAGISTQVSLASLLLRGVCVCGQKIGSV